MTKHSKNNTASSIFTYAERKKTEYGQKRQRLGNESMRGFDACSLCLQQARDPLACSSGHLFCKECVYNDLLSQKKEIKRHKDRIEAMRQQEDEEKEKAKEAARQRVLEDFQKAQLGLGLGKRLEKEKKAIESATDEVRGTKRKFDFDMEKVEVAAREAEDAALRQIERELAEARKAKLPDFWLPSLTPTAAAGPLKDIKPTTLCRAAHPFHSLVLKDLVPVTFTTLENSGSTSKSEEATRICPSCKRNLSNNIHIYFMKPCSHAVCKTCTDSLVRPSGQCVVCDKQLKKSEILELNREGTGYAGGGIAESVRSGVAFQG
ncbi:hypothetical protein M422DRAFT_36699 [Sphaerobolus stellatus SS14]|uniref:RING-type domain-containing protein n=1 Tax=Sphaerobolus stellatus (strain SS14) TaxID=990650 RepID=A0A0C9UY74_SPHS4|nr:hypothetical protein M422DRAFT_36699 [Sphaerobolus stellatus SS14]